MLVSAVSSQVCVLNTSHVHPVQTDGLSPPCHGEHKLSFLDLLQISKTIHRLFFFDGPDLPSAVSALRSSLAATLAVFLPLAGNLAFLPASGDVVLDFSPAAASSGVKFVEAEFSGGADGMRRLARDAEHDTQAFVQLVPDLEAWQLLAPVLAVQVTRPAAGGGGGAVAVGVSIRHAVVDGQAVWRVFGTPLRHVFQLHSTVFGQADGDAAWRQGRWRTGVGGARRGRLRRPGFFPCISCGGR
ncbi:malonyl-CoA:anthocyanidin 5-O-glucoside-6''-O-malonyltransferase-like [Miscanthus floridulus]|uniref:malonyl-CoA:anthocyanidin 5-O-glucoside-6''-O-malonyltransferase-like n=1 Tax=Miscanthus floridulus TaxID=154761 RepID=UPI00345760F8